MTIDIKNLQKKCRIHPARIRKIVGKILRAKGVRCAALSIVFVTDRKIKVLNTRYLNHRFATDVLSFDFNGREIKRNSHGQPLKEICDLSGEIIISPETARRQSKQFGNTLEQELNLYIVHGILHLLGYGDHRPCDIQCMRREEARILKKIK